MEPFIRVTVVPETAFEPIETLVILMLTFWFGRP